MFQCQILYKELLNSFVVCLIRRNYENMHGPYVLYMYTISKIILDTRNKSTMHTKKVGEREFLICFNNFPIRLHFVYLMHLVI